MATSAEGLTLGRQHSTLERIFANRSILLILAVLAIALGWEIYGRVSSEVRMTTAVKEALATGEPVNVVLELPFAPEQFHIKLLQKYGTVSGVSHEAVTVRRIKPGDLRELAKSYWIKRIDLEQ